MSQQKWKRSGPTLAAEMSPNTTAPADATIFGPLPRPPTGTDALWLALLDGTSLTVQLWAEVEPGVWASFGAPVALTVHAGSAALTVPSGCRIFAQVTAAAGAPTTLAAGTVYA